MSYRVKWEIDIDADTILEAAESALEIQRDSNSIATVFEIYIDDPSSLTGELHIATIDLLDKSNNWYRANKKYGK